MATRFVTPRSARLVSTAVIAAACCFIAVPAAYGQTAPQPPSQPGINELGGEGPCGSTMTVLPTLLAPGQFTRGYQPTGGGAPRTGGTCGDSHRPVAFIAHGYGGILPNFYQGLIDNLVSNGNIVVFANYTLLAIPQLAYQQVDAGYVQATRLSGGRMDLANIGIWGHSYGAGMVSWLVQRAAAHGWGSHSLWFAMHAAYTAFLVGNGPIAMPPQAHGLVVAYDQDTVVPRSTGIGIFNRLTLPTTRKEHVSVRTDCYAGQCFAADHVTPNSPPVSPENHLDFYGDYRSQQAVSDCARTGIQCDADLSVMGTWSDGHPATPAISTDNPT